MASSGTCPPSTTGSQAFDRVALAQVQKHLVLGRLVQVTQAEFEQEAVELRLGQWEGALILDGVLGGQDHERAIERACHAVDGNLALAHALQQRRLRARGGPVDFVGKQDIGEGRPGDKVELAILLIVDGHADDVVGQQVGGALDAPEGDPQRNAERPGKHGLADPRYVLQQHVTFAEEGHQHQFDRSALTDDHFLDVIDDFVCK